MMASKVTPDAAGESQKTQKPRDDHFQSLSNTKKTDSTAENRRYCGLENQGNTCYLNAVLQTLFLTKGFRQHVQRLGGRVGSSDGSLAGELKKLFSELETQQKTAVSAAGVTKSLGITGVGKQRDAAELLQLIIEKTPGSSELFKGTMEKTIICRSCKHNAGETREDFLSLSVPLQDSQEVENALKEYVDQMCGEHQLYCFDCKNTTDWEKKSEMNKFPGILIIQLRRFEITSDGYRKSDLEVIIRPHIEVSLHKYELYAIINYTGSYHDGQYYADIKCEDGIWLRFNDRSVSESSLNAVFSNESSTHRSSEACLLVYRHGEQ